jgi:hypothetical protein
MYEGGSLTQLGELFGNEIQNLRLLATCSIYATVQIIHRPYAVSRGASYLSGPFIYTLPHEGMTIKAQVNITGQRI